MKPSLPVARHSITKRFVPFALILLAVGILLIRPLPATRAASGFTAGNLVIYRVGDGTAALGSTATAVFLDEYTTAGTFVQSIPMPTTVNGSNKRLTGSGTATSEGLLTRSVDGRFLTLAGYDAALATASITTSASTTINRVIGRVDASATIDTTTALTDAISGGNPRSAVSTNGTDLWISGTSSGGGIRYATLGATTSTSLSTTPTNLRQTNIFGGQLYASSQSGAFRLSTVGSGTPTTSGQTITNLPGYPTATTSPYGFFFADLNSGVAGVDTLYVADDNGAPSTGGIQKYSLVSGSWVANGSITSTAGFRGLTGVVSGNNVTLYITSASGLSTLTDTSGYNATINGTLSSLASAGTNTAFRGVAFAPVLPTLTINDVSLNEGDTGTTSFTFTVSLSSPAGPSGVTFDIATQDGTATAPSDYTAKTLTSQTIPSGASTYTFTVLVNGDTTPEASETFLVNVTNVTGTTVGDGQGQGTIVNDDSPNLTINDVSLNEGNAGTTSFTFTVSLSVPAGAGGVTFDIATQDNTATQPSDYTAKSLTGQTIPAGSSTYTFTVLVNGDTSPETNETFFVNVTNVTGANVTDGTGLGTIVNDDAAPNLTINDVTLNEGNAGTTTFTFTVSLSSPAPAGGVTFDIATGNNTATAPSDFTAKSLTGQTIPAGSSTYTFDVLVNGDTTPEANETFFVNVTNVTNAVVTDGQGLGTIVNDDITRIHDVQGNGATTPIPGATVIVEGVVTANFQGSTKLQGFFLEEEDADADADPATSEGIFVFCNSCPTPVAEGQRVRVTGTVSEFNSMTEITASTGSSVVITDAGNHLAEVTPALISLPIVGDVNTFYEAREGMLVTFADTLTVSEYFQLSRFGQIVLTQGGRPQQFTEISPPSIAGNTAHIDELSRKQVILDDDNNAQEAYLNSPDGSQAVFYPQANGGFSVGTQGTDFFRGGDSVNGLTGVLHWSFPGFGAETWRIRPTAAHPVTFTVANPRPVTPPAVGGAIKAVSMNLLNYFTTIDTTSSNSSGPCGPSGGQDCRGADSVAELNRQRERASIVICGLNADIYGLMELENTTPSDTINDLLGAVNARCGGAHPYAFINTGSTLGTDAIRVMLIYRTGIVSPVGSPIVDLDPIHNRPPTAQTFDVVDPANPAFGKRFTVIANHFKSKGCDGSATGADADSGDGQSCYNGRRTAQATRLLTWINGTVLPAAGSPDILLLGDFNSYAKEDPVSTLSSGGYTDIASALLGPNSYSYLFDSQLGHLDYAFASSSLMPKITGVGQWHINADECDLFDYNDEVKDTGEATFEEKPDGSALVPPRVVFQPGTPFRASDHDPVIVGLFQIADLSVTKVDSPDPVVAGTNLTYTITVKNNGPDAAANASWSDTLPAGTTFVSLSNVAGWSCTMPAVGSGGMISCSNPSFAVGSAVFTLTVAVDPSVAAGTVITNTATATSDTGEGNPGNESGTATTTVSTSADLMVSKADSPDPVTAGTNLTYTITVNNAGPSNAASVSLSDTLPAGTTFVSLASPGAWSCTTPAVGSGGTVSCSIASIGVGSAVFTLTVAVDPSVAAGTVLSNTATASSSTSDPNPGNESGVATTTVAAGADLKVTKVDSPDPVTAGNNLTYTITVNNAGPSNAASVSLSDTLPAGTTFVSLSSPGGWSCTTPSVGMAGTVSCSIATLGIGNAVFTLTVNVNASASGTLSNTATASSSTSDPNPGNESGTATTTVNNPATIMCPSQPVVANTTPGLCTAQVTFTVTGGGMPPPTVSCSPSSGSVFPKGVTTVVCMASNGGTPATCSFTVVVNDNQQPSFPSGCVAPINVAAQASCPFATSAPVEFATPTATDNCSTVMVTCNPPSGSMFPLGTTTVTCTATDGSNNTATCSFPVTVYSFCLQDDSSSGNVVFVNVATGDYLFCSNGVQVASGRGTANVVGCEFSINHNKGDRKVHIQGNTSGAGSGTAFLGKSDDTMKVRITDRSMAGDGCSCSPPPPASLLPER